MKQSLLTVAVAFVCATATPLALAQTTAVGTGGSGGAGGSAAGGVATGGTATNSNAISGTSNAVGGVGQGGSGGSSSSQAVGGSVTGTTSSQAQGGNVGTVSTGGSNAQLGDVSINFNSGPAPMGKDGLGVGVDPVTGAIVSDNRVEYRGSYTVKNTPDVSIGGPASGPCNGFSGGLGVSVPGMSLGANASTVDEGCSARETARVAAMIGRMDIANAILENLPIVQAAMKAKASREVQFSPKTSERAPVQFSPAPTPVPLTQEQRDAALREQQKAAQEALQRQATMNKVYDTLKFTDAGSQSREKTAQQVMAEEANRKLVASKEEVRKPETIASAAPSASPQPVVKSEAVATTSPLASPQAIKAETIAKTGAMMKASLVTPTANTTTIAQQPGHGQSAGAPKVGDNRVTSGTSTFGTSTVEERVKAVKAIMNFQ